MARYVTDLNRAADILSEVQGTKVSISGLTPQQVLGSNAYNIYPLKSISGKDIMYVTSYSSRKSSGAGQTASGVDDAILCAVNLNKTDDGTDIEYIGGVTTVPFEFMCQAACNAAGIIQTGPAIDTKSRGILDGVTSVGSYLWESVKQNISDFGDYIVDKTYELGDLAGDLYNSAYQFLAPNLYRFKNSELGGRLQNYFSVPGINQLFAQMRQIGLWTQFYKEATHFQTHTVPKVYNSSTTVLFREIVYGCSLEITGNDGTTQYQAWNNTEDEVDSINNTWNNLVNVQWAGILSSYYDFWVGTLVIFHNGDQGLDMDVQITLEAYKMVNPTFLFTCSVSGSNSNFNEVRLRPDANPLKRTTVGLRQNFKRASLSSPYVFQSIVSKTGSMNPSNTSAGVNLLQSARIQGRFFSFAITEPAVKFIRQDPDVTPPKEDGDTVQTTYPSWFSNNNLGVVVNKGDTNETNYYVTMTPAAPVETTQINHNETIVGTIVNNNGDTVFNEYNNTVNNYITNNYITGQSGANPGSNINININITVTPSPGGGGSVIGGTDVPDTGDISVPVTPDFVANAGDFYNIYLIGTYTAKMFNKWLWSGDLLSTLMKSISQPLQAVIACGATFIPVGGYSVNGINLGNMTWLKDVSGAGASDDTGLLRVTNQFVQMYAGSVRINHWFGNAMDYEPFTSIGAYLPFVGEVSWSASEVMDSLVSVYYNVDVVTGAGVCIVQVSKGTNVENDDGLIKGSTSSVPLYMYECNLFVNIPLSQSDYSRVYSALTSAAIGIPLGIAGIDASNAVMKAFNPPMRGSQKTAIAQRSVVEGAGVVASNLGSALGNSVIPTTQQGGLGCTAGALGPRKPFVIIRRRNNYMPSGYAEYQGYPSNEKVVLRNVGGFTRVRDVHVSGIPAMSAELDMIEAILKEGVIL